jgi:hypothetical protein
MISFPGYQDFEQEVRAQKGKPVTIMLMEALEMVVGEVCIVKKPSLLKRIIRPIKKTL